MGNPNDQCTILVSHSAALQRGPIDLGAITVVLIDLSLIDLGVITLHVTALGAITLGMIVLGGSARNRTTNTTKKKPNEPCNISCSRIYSFFRALARRKGTCCGKR